MEKNRIEKLLLSKNEENTEIINEKIALEQKDVNFNYKLGGFHQIANELNLFAKKIGNSRITFEQQKFMDSLDLKEDIVLVAGTGFGKSWLMVQRFVSEISKKKSQSFVNFVHIVPNDILVIQSIREAKKLINENDTVNISEVYFPGKSNFVVATPEGFFGMTKELEENIENLSLIILDEAHLINNSNPRSDFYKFICTKILKKWKENGKPDFKRVYMSPFIENEKAFLKEIEAKDSEIKFIPLKGFTSHFLIEDPESKKWMAKSEVIKQQPSYEGGIKLFYFSSVETARIAFEKRILDSQIQRDYFLKKITAFSEVKESFSQIEKNYGAFDHGSYDLYRGWSSNKGVALYHANQPNSMKELTYLAAKNGLIKEIYASSAILNGVDLTIESITINRTKEGTEEMPYSDFMNLAGRSGRYTLRGNQILGKVTFENNDYNITWFKKNKEKIYSRKKEAPSWGEEGEDGFVKESIVAADADSENKAAYFLDPRINPKVTEMLIKNKDLTRKITKEAIAFITENAEMDFRNKEKMNKLFNETKEIFITYLQSKQKNWWDFTDWYIKGKNKQKAVQYFLRMFKYFNEEEHLSKIYWSYFKSGRKTENKALENKKNVFFERAIGVYKTQSKYQLFMYFNHIFEIAKYHGWLHFNLHDVYKAGTLDLEIVNYLAKEKKILEHYSEMQIANKKSGFDKHETLLKIKNKINQNKLPLELDK